MDEAYPYGIRDIKLTPYTDPAGTILANESVDLPAARTLSWTETEEFNTLRGDDRDVTSQGSGPSLAWDMESGGLPFEAFKVMAGGTIVETGTGTTAKKVFSKKVTDQRPYFRIEGQAISSSGGDVRTIIFRAKATGDLAGEFTDGEFHLTSGSGVGFANLIAGDDHDKLYDFVQNAEVSTFEEPNPETP